MAAAGLVVVCIVISAWKWQLLLRARRLRVGLPELVRLYWIGIFFNNLMPSSFGGDVVRLAMARRIGGLASVGASMLVERISGFLVLVLLVLAVVLMGLAPEGMLGAEIAAVALLLTGCGLLALAWWRGMTILRRLATMTPRLARLIEPMLDKLGRLVLAVGEYASDHRSLAITCGISVLFNAALILSHFTVIRAVHGDLTLSQVALVAPLVTLVTALPVSVNGIGITESAFVLLYGHIGLPPETALAAALLRRVVVVLTSLVGAALWLRGRRETQPPRQELGVPSSLQANQDPPAGPA